MTFQSSLVSILLAGIALLYQPVFAAESSHVRFRAVPTQYIAAVGNPDASAGSGAQYWGIWRRDPGPRGVFLRDFNQLQSRGGLAPARWQFDEGDWWLDENGLLMEKPEFKLPPGNYLVTGDRETTTVLTVYPEDRSGNMRWQLHNGARLYDVTHLPCRSARYTPISADARCSPAQARQVDFPLNPGAAMPAVAGCHKQDFAVLFVIGVEIRDPVTVSAVQSQ